MYITTDVTYTHTVKAYNAAGEMVSALPCRTLDSANNAAVVMGRRYAKVVISDKPVTHEVCRLVRGT